MLRSLATRLVPRLRAALKFAAGASLVAACATVHGQTISNVQQLTLALDAEGQVSRAVDLEATVCATSRPQVGVIILQDTTGAELLELGNFDPALSPGARVRLRAPACWLRKREMGVELSALPVVNNDGMHLRTAATGQVDLVEGKIPLRLDWFNYRRSFALDVAWAAAGQPLEPLASSNLWQSVSPPAGEVHYSPGLQAQCYEGLWESLPDFDLFAAVKSGSVSQINLDFRSRDEGVGLRFSGFLDVPRTGRYQFAIGSDDGAALFLGDSRVPLLHLGHAPAPPPQPSFTPTNLAQRCWTAVEGRVSFVTRVGAGVRLDLGAERSTVSLGIADAAGLDLASLLHARVRLTGVGRGTVAWDRTLVLGRLFAANARDLVILDPPYQGGSPTQPITTVAQVQSLPIAQARLNLPVRIRGVVTGAIKGQLEHWMSIQDDTRGVFVRLDALPEAAPVFGELWEVEGHSAAGDFAPIIVADRVKRLGEGLLPTPVNPTWTELLNGSRDVQWAELKGVVTEVHSNVLALHLPEGRLEVQLDDALAGQLLPFRHAVVRLRGVLYAVWESATREVRVGRVMMRNTAISVESAAPADPFDAVLRSPRELLQFDAQASALRPVKVRGQIEYSDASQLILEEGGLGLRLLPAETNSVRPGDLVEAVGYSEIGPPLLQLREVLVRKTGSAPLPPPKSVDATSLSAAANAVRVRLEGRLLGWHFEAGSQVLELQAGARLLQARIAPGTGPTASPRLGSRLALVGVLVGRGLALNTGDGNPAYELLLNSPAEVIVLSQPSWWTLPRLFALVGVLVVILTFTVIWNTQLRRQVEQRTQQLQQETRERERVEQQRALEAERSRIARDLHDDLGSSLTEITVLASSGQLRGAAAGEQPGLFQAIGAKARSLVSALDVIVWAVDPEDNSLQSLADYLSGYTDDFFAHTPIACRFKVPVSFPPITLEGRVRHDLLMAVKEALNNIVRHSGATEAELRMALTDGALEIELSDNGKGLEREAPQEGHGLKNLATRMQKLGGSCAIHSLPAGGTRVAFRLPLAAA